MTERFRRVNYGNMEIEVTVDDAKAYTKSWTVKVNHRIMLDTCLIEFLRCFLGLITRLSKNAQTTYPTRCYA